MTEERYIPLEKLKAWLAEPFPPPPGEEPTAHLLHDRIDHAGQNCVMFLPEQMFGNEHAQHINWAHWGSLDKDIGGVGGNWMYLPAQFDEDAQNGVPTIPADKIRLLLSVFHYLYNEQNERGAYFRDVIEKTFEILDLGQPMDEQELLANTQQIKTLGTLPRRSFALAGNHA